MEFYSMDPSISQKEIHPFRMEKMNTNDTFEIKQYSGELLISSLFNFLCYYKLDVEVGWTIHLQDDLDKMQGPIEQVCTANLNFSNENYLEIYQIKVINDDHLKSDHSKPWIYRGFLILLSLFSALKLRMHIVGKKKKLHKLRNNIISNEFEFKVRLNSKKSL